MNSALPHRRVLHAAHVPFLIALCPLLAASTTLLRAAALGAALLVVLFVTALATSLLRRWFDASVWLPALALIVAAAAAAMELIFDAWLHGLYQSLELLVALVASNGAAYLYFADDRESNVSTGDAITRGLRLGGAILVAMLVLGFAREIVGYGSVFHDADQVFGSAWTFGRWSLFDADMGFLLAVLPPGAFISAGILFALLNAWRARHE